MIVELTGRNVEITATIEKRVRRALEKLGRLLDDSASVHVVIASEKHRHKTEILVNWHDHKFTGIAETPDIYSSVREAIDRVQRQTLKQKEKFATRRRVTRKVVKAVPVERVVPEPRLIRTPRSQVKPMTPEEAADLIAQSDDHFFVFRNAETERIAVIYKRKDGNLGLIES